MCVTGTLQWTDKHTSYHEHRQYLQVPGTDQSSSSKVASRQHYTGRLDHERVMMIEFFTNALRSLAGKTTLA